MSITPQSKCCPKCGGPIPAEAPEGLCPKCLFQQACVPTEAGRKGESAKSAPPTHEELAAAFPQLEILELIGQGGMGFVFKARQPKIERLVALKILPQSLAADPAFAERFAREARMLARLNHPNIVAIHDFGQAGGLFYLLMEYVDGVNLRQAMKAGRFTPAQAMSVVPKICEALQFAHNEGILHRDIKPENILLDSKGRVKIADFGIAKLVGEPHPDDSLTASGVVLGTANYMAPEQLERSAEVDQRADIYSLGVVFYEMLTGELPLGRFQPPSKKVQVDVRLDEVVLHALEKEPARRYQQVSQVKTAVETISGSPAGPTAPVGTPPLVAAAAAPAQPPDRFWRRFAVVVLALIMIPVGISVLGTLAAIVMTGFVKVRHRAQQQHAVAALQTNAASHLVQKENAQPGITVVLRNATNAAHSVSLETAYPLLPGETLLALTKLPDGRMETSAPSISVSHWGTETRMGTALSWSFPDYFGAHELESAVFQLRRNIQGRPTRLTLGEPLALFSVTNQFGDALSGYLEFQRVVPKPPGPDERVHASVTLNTPIPAFYSGAYYSANVPPGYRLLATASPSRHEGSSISGTYGSSSWSPPDGFLTSRAHEAMARQLEDMARQGPIQVFLGEPRLLFSITNDAGAVYRGFFELVGPPAAAALPEQLSPAGGSSEAVPSLAPPAVEGKFIMDTWGSGRAEPEPGELDWTFKCFVPPGSLASILLVRWTNGVPQVYPGLSAYFKVGKGGGIDLPFCMLLCHRLVGSESWTKMSEDERRQALARMGYPESAGVTNAFYWSVNLGSGYAESCWTNMPPYHGLQLQLPQSVRSAHQRAIRLIDFDKGSQGQSGVELRIFLEPLTSPPIRMFPNEVDHTNYISGTGLAGTMEDALSAIREWPTDP